MSLPETPRFTSFLQSSQKVKFNSEKEAISVCFVYSIMDFDAHHFSAK
jgi:hypothetical protein